MFLFQRDMRAVNIALIDLNTSSMLIFLVVLLAIALVFYLWKVSRIGSFQQSLRVNYLANSLVLMPLDRWSSITKKGLSLAVQLRGQVRIIHVDDDNGTREEFESLWHRNVVTPLRDADRIVPELIVLSSHSGQILQPIAEYILETERVERDRQIIVVVPQLAVRHWWEKPLHNHRSRLLKLILAIFGGHRILIIDVSWHL